MPTPSYSEIIKYSGEVTTLSQATKREIANAIRGKKGYELVDAALQVVEKYGMQAQELGAQWLELCAKYNDIDGTAIVDTLDLDGYQYEFEDLIAANELGELTDEELYQRIEDIAEDVAANHSRDAIYENMVREQFLDPRLDPTETRVRYARVPVGETCAWCIMLASLGAWYTSYESAGGLDPDHYHAHCDCVVVPYADPDDIPGYASSLGRYRAMYYTADEYRQNVRRGNDAYPEDLRERIERAKERHLRLEDSGYYKEGFTDYNETLIVMRYQNPELTH